MILNGILEAFGLSKKSVPIFRVLDKLPKIGRKSVLEEMVQIDGVSTVAANNVIGFASVSGDNHNILSEVEDIGKATWTNTDEEHASYSKLLLESGVRNIRELLNTAKSAGVPEGRIKIDLSIARGLDYYTGTIYETFLTDLPEIGSVCSGGRYDNLAGLYTNQVLPGVGASLGVDRLLAAMEKLDHTWMTGQSTPAPVIVLNLDASLLGTYQKLARDLRAAGVGVEVYPDAKKLGPQFQYAEKRGFRLAVIVGPDEAKTGKVKVKDLRKREEVVLDADDHFVSAVRTLLPECKK